MGLFGIGRKKSDSRNQVFANCDFEFAKNQLISTFSFGVYPKELTELLDAYIEHSCRQTGMGLIRYNKDFRSLFYNNKETLKWN